MATNVCPLLRLHFIISIAVAEVLLGYTKAHLMQSNMHNIYLIFFTY